MSARIADQLLRQCVHFTGVQHKTCGIGVSYKAVRDASQPGPYRWPCVDGGAVTQCGLHRRPTREEAEAQGAEMEQALKLALADLGAGLCPTCRRKVERRRQDGNCIYAEPCGHRLGQGRA